MRRSVSGENFYLVKWLVFGIIFIIISTILLELIARLHPRIARLKFKKSVFAAVASGVFAVNLLVARKYCIAWQEALILSAGSAGTFAFVAGASFFKRSILLPQKKKMDIPGLGKKHFLAPCLAVGALFLLFNYLYLGCGFSCVTSLLVFMAGFFFVGLIIGIYGEVKSWKKER